MPKPPRATWAILILCGAACAAAAETPKLPFDTDSPQVQSQARELAQQSALAPPRVAHPGIDRSGRKQEGVASVYAAKFQGRLMANGKPFDQRGDAVASKTLPLGTIAKVTNLKTGKTALVTVQDRGPFVTGRIVDLPAATAEKIGIDKQGVAPVVVAPIAVPQADDKVKPGAGAVPGPANASSQP